MSKIITLNCDYVQGFLRSGHFELELSEEDYNKFKSSSEEEQIDWITDCGELIIDSYRVEDYETSGPINISDK